jgi:hypothetical protein
MAPIGNLLTLPPSAPLGVTYLLRPSRLHNFGDNFRHNARQTCGMGYPRRMNMRDERARGFEHKERQIAKPTIVEPSSVKPIRQTDLRHTAYRD